MIDEDTYEWYMTEIAELMGKDTLSERERCWLEEMAYEVCRYEEHHYPMDPPTPEEAAEFRREQENKK